jgi:hypothetical protein
MADLLSPYMNECQSTGTPIIRSLYLSPLSFSTPCFIATNSAPKTDVLIVDCRFETQSMQAWLMKMKKPVCDGLVCFSPAWSLSTHMQMSTGLTGFHPVWDKKVEKNTSLVSTYGSVE